jgi:hypothetical protein
MNYPSELRFYAPLGIEWDPSNCPSQSDSGRPCGDSSHQMRVVNAYGRWANDYVIIILCFLIHLLGLSQRSTGAAENHSGKRRRQKQTDMFA